MYKIRRTKTGDMDIAMQMYEHSRALMRNAGNDKQWTNGYPSPEVIAGDIAKENSYIIEHEGTPCGIFAFVLGKDPTYRLIVDGQWESDNRPYGTIHRLAKREGYHGVGKACFEWCKTMATSLRVDTHSQNNTMQHILEETGFVKRGIIFVSDGSPRIAYQMLNTKRLCSPLTEYIEKNAIPLYKDFDAAHDERHVRHVLENSLRLAEECNADKNMVYTVAAYHDIGLGKNREMHHVISKEILTNDHNLHKWFDQQQIETMGDAVEDHRASSKREPRSLYGKIISDADRDIDPERVVERATQYSIDHFPDYSKEQLWIRTHTHLMEKYSRQGYLKLWLNQPSNIERLGILHNTIDDEEETRRLFEITYSKTSR